MRFHERKIFGRATNPLPSASAVDLRRKEVVQLSIHPPFGRVGNELASFRGGPLQVTVDRAADLKVVDNRAQQATARSRQPRCGCPSP